MSYVAMVIGSTGAIGRDLVAELVQSPKCTKVIALTRRDVPSAQWSTTFPALDVKEAETKLEIRKINFDNIAEENVAATERVDAAFCCLGTTRKDAGSAEAFRKVDLEYVTRFAELSKGANVPYFGLVSSVGASKSSWFLYPQTKGEAEENIKNLAFARTSIFRPALLKRGDLARMGEKLIASFVPNITTQAVAKAMVADYENGSTSADVKEWTNAEMKAFE